MAGYSLFPPSNVGHAILVIVLYTLYLNFIGQDFNHILVIPLLLPLLNCLPFNLIFRVCFTAAISYFFIPPRVILLMLNSDYRLIGYNPMRFLRFHFRICIYKGYVIGKTIVFKQFIFKIIAFGTVPV